MKKIAASVIAAAMLAVSVTGTLPASDTAIAAGTPSSVGNYAGALQQSLFFYECQQSGKLPEWNRVSWKGDCALDDKVPSGWFDAGDHVKFNLPMAYSASMLAWGLYQYGEGVEKIGQYEIYQNNLEYVLDYFADCDLGTEVIFQEGNGTEDHTWWGPVELYELGLKEGSYYKRPYYTTTASCVTAEMAAALAAGAAALNGKTDKTANYIKHAENMFKIADKTRSDADYNDSDASGFYRSSSFYDDLFYAANWLYIATGDKAYLEKAGSYIPSLGKELGSDELKYSWTQCWDDTMQGGMLLYAISTQDPTYIARVEKHVDYWTNKVTQISGGLRYLDTWGSLRYATTAGFTAAVACDTVLKGSSAVDSYKKFYKQQIDYALGDNPDGRCYVVGLDETSPHNPHHRTAHGSWKNAMETPTESRHILYGALVGGPDQSGKYEDNRGNYINNEVATDYNAGFTALLCKMVSEYGGKTDPSFPPTETPVDEYYVDAAVKTLDSSGITVSLKFTNHTAWPARYQDNMSFRYFMDLSEVKALGKNPEDIAIRCDRNQSEMYSECTPAKVSGVKHYDGDIYYVEVEIPDGKIALPISEGRQQCEFLIALVMPDYGSGWDATNDFSNKDILGKTDDEKSVKSQYIPVYYNGELVYGEEPDGTKAPSAPQVTKPVQPTTTKPAVTTKPEVTTTKPAETTSPVTTAPKAETTQPPVTTGQANAGGTTSGSDKIIYGDIDLSGVVDLSDLTVLSQYLLKDVDLTTAQYTRADVTGDGEVGITDLSLLKQYVMKDQVVLGPKK